MSETTIFKGKGDMVGIVGQTNELKYALMNHKITQAQSISGRVAIKLEGDRLIIELGS